MNAHGLNQTGDKTPPHLLIGDKVYFYRPPTQQEVIKRTRKAKHLAHYHGPATILSNVDERERQYNVECQGKIFKRHIGMLIPEKWMHHAGTRDYDPTMEGLARSSAKAYSKSDPLQEGILILCKTEKNDKGWYLAEIDKIYPDEIEVTYFSTPGPSLENYETSSKDQRLETLSEACFRKTWYTPGQKCGNGYLPSHVSHQSGAATLERKTAACRSRGLDTSHQDHARSSRVPIEKLSPAGEPTRRRPRSARNRGGQGRAAGRLEASELTVLLRGSQALRLRTMQKEIDTQRQ
jgi:hypothetical protein